MGSGRARTWLIVGLVALVAVAVVVVADFLDEEPGDETRAPRAGVDPSDPVLRGAREHPAKDSDPSPVRETKPGSVTRIRGAVVLPSGDPAADVEVGVRAEGEAVRATTSPEGRYDAELELRDRGEAVLVSAHASDAAGRAGAVGRWCWGESSAFDLPAIVLGEASALRVRVERDGQPAPGADVSVLAWGGELAVPFAHATCDPRGEVLFPQVPGSAVYVLAAGPGRGRASRVVALPTGSTDAVVIALPEDRIIDVRILALGTRAPIEGASLWLREKLPFGHARIPTLLASPPDPTDAEGRSQVRGVGEGLALEIRAEAVDHVGSRWRPVGVATGSDTEVVIELRPLERIAFPLRDEGDGIPADGSEIRLSPFVFRDNHVLAPTGRIEGETLVVFAGHGGFFSAIATAPDGTMARLLANRREKPSAVAFRRPAEIEVRVTYPDGSPASGRWVKLHRGTQRVHWPAKPTNAEGTVTFAWPRDTHEVSVILLEDEGAGPWASGDRKLGSTMLEDGRAVFDVILPWRREVALRVTVSGERRLPREYAIHVGPRRIEAVREDRAAGEVRFDWRPTEGDTDLVLRAPGIVPARATLPNDPVPDTLTLDLVLVPGGTLFVDVREPADRMVTLEVQRFDAGSGRWAVHQRGSGAYLNPDLLGRYRFDGLEPGLYRVLDPYSSAGSDETEVTLNGPATLGLDCSQAGHARGTVEVPKGYDVSQALVVLTGGMRTAAYTPPHGDRSVRVGKNGTFSLRVPGNREVLVRAVHPELIDDPGRGVRLVEPRTDVVLSLEAGAQARLTLEPWPGHLDTWKEPVDVWLYEGPLDGEPVAKHKAIVRKPELRFGGFAPGRYTIWVDAGGGAWAGQDNVAPLHLAGVLLGEGLSVLGPVATSRGGQVRVKLLLDDPESTRRQRVSVIHQGEPSYARTAFSYGKGQHPIVVSGLGPGTFEVRVDVDGGTIRRTQVVESDGEGETEVTLDLRTR